MPSILTTPRHLDRPSPADRWRLRVLVPVFALLQLSSVAAEFIAASAFEPSYNWVTNTISELGVNACTSDFDPRTGVEACSPLAGLMNGGMVVAGISLVVLALLLRRSRGFAGLPGVLWIIAGLGSAVTGFVSLETSPVLHQLVSAPLFFGGPLAILLGSFQFRGWLRGVGAGLGGVALILGVIFSTSDLVYGFGGIVERLVIWPSLAWVVLLAFRARADAAAR